MKKIDEEIVREKFKEKGFIMLGEYQNYDSSILFEKDGYKGFISYNSLINKKKSFLFSGKNPYQKQNIELLVKRKNPNIELLNIYNIVQNGKNRIVIEMKCSCGNKFTTRLDKILSNKYLLCRKCARELAVKNRKNNYNKKYKKNIESQGFTILNDKDLYALERVEVEENETGYRGFISPFRKVKNMLTFSLEHNRSNFIYNINILIKSQGYKTEALKLVDNDTKILSKCECGKTYKAELRSFYNGNCVCDDCSSKMSNNERVIKNFLEEQNVSFIKEFIINSCRDKYPLPFDFCLNKINKMIEVDGEQHDVPIAFDNNMEKANKRLKIQQEHDRIKNEYCAKHNIPLLRISYKDIKDNSYKEKILNFINAV